MGRYILPYTHNLIDWGLLERINPDAPKVCGYIHRTTEDGLEVIDEYFESLQSIGVPCPEFGF
ncbi:MAG: hypothetical protein AAF329_06040 [Cyanobacteria bacterium P01_A01_bin.17]